MLKKFNPIGYRVGFKLIFSVLFYYTNQFIYITWTTMQKDRSLYFQNSRLKKRQLWNSSSENLGLLTLNGTVNTLKYTPSPSLIGLIRYDHFSHWINFIMIVFPVHEDTWWDLIVDVNLYWKIKLNSICMFILWECQSGFRIVTHVAVRDF